MAFTIDPDPSSPTLGDVLDQESRRDKRPAPRREPVRSILDAGPALPRVPPISAPRIVPPIEQPITKQRLGGAVPPSDSHARPAVVAPARADRAPSLRPAPEAYQLPADWPVLDDERALPRREQSGQRELTVPREPVLPVSRPVSATPVVPRNAAVVNQPRAIARPKNLPVLPAQPPLPPLLEDKPVEPAAILVEPKGALAVLPPRREPRQIALHTQPGMDVKLLRDPTVTNSAEPTPEPSPADLVQPRPASAPIPPVRPPPKARPAEAQPMRPLSAPQVEAPRAQPQPVLLPPLEEPPRVAPRARAPEPAPKPTLPPPVQPAAVDPDKFVYVVDQDLRQFLTDFSRRVGLRADVAATVRGRLTRVKLPLEPTALLKDLEKRFDLEWLIEGEILKVASRSDLATRILALGPVGYDDLIREMRGLDIDVQRYPLKRLSESNSVIITAPSSYIGRISALIDTLRAGRSVGPELRIVRNGVSRKVDWE